MKYQIGDCSNWINVHQISQLWLWGKSYFPVDAALECSRHKSNYKNDVEAICCHYINHAINFRGRNSVQSDLIAWLLYTQRLRQRWWQWQWRKLRQRQRQVKPTFCGQNSVQRAICFFWSQCQFCQQIHWPRFRMFEVIASFLLFLLQMQMMSMKKAMRNKRKINLLMTRNFCIDKVDDLNDDEFACLYACYCCCCCWRGTFKVRWSCVLACLLLF